MRVSFAWPSVIMGPFIMIILMSSRLKPCQAGIHPQSFESKGYLVGTRDDLRKAVSTSQTYIQEIKEVRKRVGEIHDRMFNDTLKPKTKSDGEKVRDELRVFRDQLRGVMKENKNALNVDLKAAMTRVNRWRRVAPRVRDSVDSLLEVKRLLNTIRNADFNALQGNIINLKTSMKTIADNMEDGKYTLRSKKDGSRFWRVTSRVYQDVNKLNSRRIEATLRDLDYALRNFIREAPRE